MNTPIDKQTTQSGDAVEALLRQATPRPGAPQDIERDIRSAVYDEWRDVVGARRQRRLVGGLAAAATVLVAITAAIMSLDGNVAPTNVATFAKTHGSIMIESRGSGQEPAENFAAVMTGHTLLTASGSAAGLDWHNGGSLRVDEKTRVEFVAGDAIYLHSGRVYFDSGRDGAEIDFTIRTPHGDLTHFGTQYMAESTPASLIVSVREGEVWVAGTFHDEIARAGQVLNLTGNSGVLLTSTSGTGGGWEWVESVAPAVDMEGKSIHDFLTWVGRETGHEIDYASDAARQHAAAHQFRGNIERDPRSELQLYMLASDLDARFVPDDSTILVSVPE